MGRVCLIGSTLLDEDEARVPALDRGFLYGDGLFETLRVYRGRPYRLEAHWRRLGESCRFLGLPPPPDDPAALVARVLGANRLVDASLRVTWSRGPRPAGPRPGTAEVEPTLLVQARPLRDGLLDAARDGVAGRLTPWPSRCRNSPLHRHKTLAYLASVAALATVAEGEEPLLWNGHGELAEGATSNLFWVRNGVLHTPHPDTGCLPGVTRQVLLGLARSGGTEVVEGFRRPAALAAAEEAFLTNSVLGVAPLVTLDGTPLGSGAPGPVTRRLQRAYWEDVTAETR